MKNYIENLDKFREKVVWLEFNVFSESDYLSEYVISETKNDRYGFSYFWRGADVYITKDSVDNYEGSKIICITPHASIISAMLIWCVKHGGDIFDHINKYVFFGSIANAVVFAHKNSSKELSLIDVQLVVIDCIKENISAWRKKAEGHSN